MKFKIAIVGGPAENYIDKCLQSVLSQKVDYDVAVVLDPVGDQTYNRAIKYASNRMIVKLNEIQCYATANLLYAVRLLNPAPDDVIVLLDADDWFKHELSLWTVQQCYEKYPSTLVTYGSWEGYPDPNCPTNCAAYQPQEFSHIRTAAWKGTHLRTMRYRVWSSIRDESLRDKDGNYFRTAWDLAFMFPALEMAGYNRSKFIPEKIYVYNRETPHNDEKLRSPEQTATANYIKNLKPVYSLI